MSLPFLIVLHKNFPNARISLLIKRSMKDIFQLTGFVEKFYFADSLSHFTSFLSLCRTLKKRRYTVYIGTIPSNTFSRLLLPLLARIPVRIKHTSPHRGCRNLDFVFHFVLPLSPERHRVECNLDLLLPLGVNLPIQVNRPLISLNSAYIDQVKEKLELRGYRKEQRMIAVHAGCSRHAMHKRWPPENYIHLIHRLQNEGKFQILLVGGPDEIEDINFIYKAVTVKPINIAGQMNLLETAAALTLCDRMICNDSGIMHLAAAVDIPVIAIFGPTDEKHIGPYGSKHVVIRNGTNIGDVSVDQVCKFIIEKREDFYKLN